MLANFPMKRFRSFTAQVSLARALSKLGVLSRSQATQAILDGRVSCNGVVKNNPEFRVDPKRVRLALDGQALDPNPKRIYLMLNKPRGLVTTRDDEKGRATVFDCLKSVKEYIFPVGRLDAESEGLLLFTNDSQFAESVTSPLAKVPKVYEVDVNRPVSTTDIDVLMKGIEFPDGTKARPKSVRTLGGEGSSKIEVILDEGKNREIRRICEGAGFEVTRLLRTQIGDLRLENIEPGNFRPMNASEISAALGGKPMKHYRRPQGSTKKRR